MKLRNHTRCADCVCVRGTSNSFGVPYEPTPSDLSPSVDDLIHHGETTWEVSFRVERVASRRGSWL
jgi:hypothetical protein